MKFKIFASILVLAVVAAMVIIIGGDFTPHSTPSNNSAPEFSPDAVNSMRQ